MSGTTSGLVINILLCDTPETLKKPSTTSPGLVRQITFPVTVTGVTSYRPPVFSEMVFTLFQNSYSSLLVEYWWTMMLYLCCPLLVELLNVVIVRSEIRSSDNASVF